MENIKRTKEQEREREERILEHARNGHTMVEIADLEGLDATNLRGWHKLVRDAGIQIEKKRLSEPPSGLKKPTLPWRARVGFLLARLRDNHSQIEVSRLVGINNRQYLSATKSYTHDWTVSQLQRLADAQGMTFEHLVSTAFTTNPKGKY